jgi:hypothetical protein
MRDFLPPGAFGTSLYPDRSGGVGFRCVVDAQ